MDNYIVVTYHLDQTLSQALGRVLIQIQILYKMVHAYEKIWQIMYCLCIQDNFKTVTDVLHVLLILSYLPSLSVGVGATIGEEEEAG